MNILRTIVTDEGNICIGTDRDLYNVIRDKCGEGIADLVQELYNTASSAIDTLVTIEDICEVRSPENAVYKIGNMVNEFLQKEEYKI